ncbi:aminopeptidase N [Reyranella sp.]|uniref:aminopeptidase N n=1 Tax=Reyranella sp. TaxID=1929291 RepID=UPI002726D1F7|nr:aminopeptidase N [Reyranella sp.]MDO8973936.1 aminopeptidase N [Reyranella sp.]
MDISKDMTTPPGTIRRIDYTPPPFLIETVDLDVELGKETTGVVARLAVRRNPAAVSRPADLVLDGKKMGLVSVRLDGKPASHEMTPETLILRAVPDSFSLEIKTRLRPRDNTELTGLYKSRDLFCTQCEAEGFRRITYFLDRPDVMARYTTRIVADRALAPVLLSNGNLVDSGALDDGRHFARWEDPFPKPSYLFALVAGPLECLEDRFTTRSGREVTLRIYVRPGDVGRCGHAMESLKKSMKWDEDVYGLEYDLDTFMIVAIDDFNMGAMENKGLNVFNSKLVLANPETATDLDYHSIEAVVAHEYFHNWTGNRVTCRDWFQLSLKEGLTVFRDQQFSADMGSAADARIDDVRRLRASQFPEDAGPMAHPVRPDSYIEINNFYTATVYQKGAEVVRMMHTLLGPERYRKGMDLYFQRHDGQAVTCDDFASAMEDASGVDLAQFRLWYAQAGTPDVRVEGRYDAAGRRYTLTVTQSLRPTPGQPGKKPMHIPLAVGLLDGAGRDLPLRLAGEAAAGGATRVLDLRTPRDVFVFEDVPEKPVASLLRGFSAPVKLDAPRSDDELTFLMAHDSDPFARWEAGQQLGARLILELVEARKAGSPMVVPDHFVDAIRRTLDDQRLDRSFIADAVTLPGLAFLGELMPEIDIEGLWAAQQRIRSVLSDRLADRWGSVYDANHATGPYRFTPGEVGRRRLRSTALSYLSTDKGEAARRRAVAYFESAGNMTESISGLSVLAELGGREGAAALAAFHERWKGEALVLDKWFGIQARTPTEGTLERVKSLVDHPSYDRRNPNRVYSLIGAFASGNPVQFHQAGGAGYRFLADQVLATDRLNPQIAARLLGPLGSWRRYDKDRRDLMRQELERIVAEPGLSRDVFEIASKSLA